MFRSILLSTVAFGLGLSATQIQAQNNDFIATDPAIDSLMCLGVYALVVREDKSADTSALRAANSNAVKVFNTTANNSSLEGATAFSVDSIEQMVKDGPDSLAELHRLCDNEFAPK